jgi:beta-phosphoglucomutase family hydrolase
MGGCGRGWCDVLDLVRTFEGVTGLIFDCDGTLADTMPPHFVAWDTTLRKYGMTLDEDEFYAWGGWPTVVVAKHVIDRAGKDLDATPLAFEKEALFETVLDTVQPIPVVLEVARHFRGQKPMAVASGGMRRIVRRVLEVIDADKLFDAVVTAEDVVRHKPEPDIFLEAARRIGVDPAGCVVFEDAEPGIEAARRAGMRVVDVRAYHRPRRMTA